MIELKAEVHSSTGLLRGVFLCACGSSCLPLVPNISDALTNFYHLLSMEIDGVLEASCLTFLINNVSLSYYISGNYFYCTTESEENIIRTFN